MLTRKLQGKNPSSPVNGCWLRPEAASWDCTRICLSTKKNDNKPECGLCPFPGFGKTSQKPALDKAKKRDGSVGVRRATGPEKGRSSSGVSV